MKPEVELATMCRALMGNRGPAVRFEGAWLDWADISRLAASVDAGLSQLTAPGERIAFAPLNHPASLAAFLPLLARGHDVTMLYPFQRPAALARALEAAGCRVAVLDERDASGEVLETLQRSGIACLALGAGSARLVCEGQAQPRAGRYDPAGAPARIHILTSGTTGAPKPFAISYAVVHGYIREAEARDRGSAAPPLLFFPLSNISGLYSTAQSFLRGQPVVLLERFRLEDWLDYVREYRPAVGGVPPAAIAMILNADIPREELASIRFMATGAAPVDPETMAAFAKRYGIPILQSYGATEFAGPVTAMTPDLLAAYGPDKALSVGRPLGSARLRIVAVDGGQELPAGETGVVEVVSPRLGPDWVRTTDLGMIDPDGFLFLKGRLDGAIMRGGFKVIPEVVEQALLSHPAVREASVVGLPDKRLFAVPAAAIVAARSLTAGEIEDHLRQRLAAPQIPAHWRFVDELPRTVSFKVDRRAVQALFGDT